VQFHAGAGHPRSTGGAAASEQWGGATAARGTLPAERHATPACRIQVRGLPHCCGAVHATHGPADRAWVPGGRIDCTAGGLHRLRCGGSSVSRKELTAPALAALLLEDPTAPSDALQRLTLALAAPSGAISPGVLGGACCL
jgi:hypothetical protein